MKKQIIWTSDYENIEAIAKEEMAYYNEELGEEMTEDEAIDRAYELNNDYLDDEAGFTDNIDTLRFTNLNASDISAAQIVAAAAVARLHADPQFQAELAAARAELAAIYGP